jgi:hypothetical protein
MKRGENGSISVSMEPLQANIAGLWLSTQLRANDKIVSAQ